MIDTMAMKMVPLLPPVAATTGQTQSTVSTQVNLDTKGWDFAEIVVWFGATSVAMAVLKLQESDTSATVADSSYADITGANFATGTCTDGTAAVLPSATDDGLPHCFHVSLKKRKRYLQVTWTNGAATVPICIFAILSRGKEAPNTFSERGFTNIGGTAAEIKV